MRPGREKALSSLRVGCKSKETSESPATVVVLEAAAAGLAGTSCGFWLPAPIEMCSSKIDRLVARSGASTCKLLGVLAAALPQIVPSVARDRDFPCGAFRRRRVSCSCQRSRGSAPPTRDRVRAVAPRERTQVRQFRECGSVAKPAANDLSREGHGNVSAISVEGPTELEFRPRGATMLPDVGVGVFRDGSDRARTQNLERSFEANPGRRGEAERREPSDRREHAVGRTRSRPRTRKFLPRERSRRPLDGTPKWP